MTPFPLCTDRDVSYRGRGKILIAVLVLVMKGHATVTLDTACTISGGLRVGRTSAM